LLLMTWSVLGGFAPAVAAFALGALRRTRARWKFHPATGQRRGWLYYVLPFGTYVVCVLAAAAAFRLWSRDLHDRDVALLGLFVGLTAAILHGYLAFQFARRQFYRYL
jgi:hypothetical protein